MIHNENNQVLYPQGLKRCNRCHLIKPFKDFPIKDSKRRKHRWAPACKPCEHERQANLRARHRADPKWYCATHIAQLQFRANEIGVPFDLSSEDLFALWQQQNGKCYYTGEIMDFLAYTSNRRNPHRDYPSIDRKVPSLGYVKNNIAWCRYYVNRMKNDLTEEQFISFCRQVLNLYPR